MNTEMNTEKTCSTCKETKPISSFSKDRTKADGLNHRCKLCVKEYQRRYREQNSDELRERQRRYREQNKAAVRERNRRYNEQNSDELREYQRRYREQNSDELRERTRRYHAANPQVKGTMGALRRSPLTESELFAGASRDEVNAEVRFDFILRDLLTEKTGIKHHVDHIKPLCEGGVHRMWNLAVITEEQNLAKGPIWFCEDHLSDDDIEAQDEATLAFVPAE